MSRQVTTQTFPSNTNGGASASGAWVELSYCTAASMTFRFNTSGANLVGTVTLRGTNNPVQDVAEPPLLNTTIITNTNATQITMTAGVISIATGIGAGIIAFTVVLPAFPQFVKADYVFTSGGGTVVMNGYVSGWGAQ
jgi:hypothetical protein